MKVVLLLLMTVSVCTRSGAQGFFNQKGAWIKNQIQQIALWEIYIKDLEKGYAIAKNGLNTIGDIKNGDWHLHLDHFNALMEVSPAIQKYSKAMEILSLASAIKKLVSKSDDMYVQSVWSHLLAGCEEDVNVLNTLLKAGNFQLTDDERIRQIDNLFADMEEKYAFARNFSRDIRVLSLQQSKETHEIKSSRLLNNLQP